MSVEEGVRTVKCRQQRLDIDIILMDPEYLGRR